MTIALAIAAGILIGLSLGALGGGGSILAVPVLVYSLGQTPAQATTGSLVVVGVTSLLGAIAAQRAGYVALGRGVIFGVAATGGAVAGARAAGHVPGPILLASFSVLMLVVATVMVARQVRGRGSIVGAAPPRLDDPLVTLRPTFACQCPRVLKLVVTATGVGLLTGFLGVGGGFLVVPALVIALSLPMRYAPGTSLVAITITSAVALAARAGAVAQPDWGVVALLSVAAAVGGVVGARIGARTDTRTLAAAFSGLVLVVAAATAAKALPALL